MSLFFPTKSPQLETTCYLRKLLCLFQARALLSVFGRFFFIVEEKYKKKAIEQNKTVL